MLCYGFFFQSLNAVLLLVVCVLFHQASTWDVDGTGMQQVPTAELDLALRKVGGCPWRENSRWSR